MLRHSVCKYHIVQLSLSNGDCGSFGFMQIPHKHTLSCPVNTLRRRLRLLLIYLCAGNIVAVA